MLRRFMEKMHGGPSFPGEAHDFLNCGSDYLNTRDYTGNSNTFDFEYKRRKVQSKVYKVKNIHKKSFK